MGKKIGEFFATTAGMVTLFVLGAAVMYVIIGGTSSNWQPWTKTA